MPAPSKTQYSCKADAEDDIVCQYKGLRPTVLHNLHASGFDTTRYTDLSEVYRQTAFDKKASATTRHESKQIYVAEKRKVLRALAGSKARNGTAKSQKLRLRRQVASESSRGSKQRCVPEKHKQTEQVPVVNLAGVGDQNQREAEQPLLCVLTADNEEDGRARSIELVVQTVQPSDIATLETSQNDNDQCAKHDIPIIEEGVRASIDSEDFLLAEVCVLPALANNQRTDNVVGGECVGAMEQLSVIAVQSSAHNKEVECPVDGPVDVQELGLTFATSKDSTSLEVKSAVVMSPSVLSVERYPAGFAERSSVRRRMRQKTKRLLFDPMNLAGHELGAGDWKRSRDGISTEISASGCAKTSSRGVHSVLDSMESHQSTLCPSVAHVCEIRSRTDAAMTGRRSNKS